MKHRSFVCHTYTVSLKIKDTCDYKLLQMELPTYIDSLIIITQIIYKNGTPCSLAYTFYHIPWSYTTRL